MRLKSGIFISALIRRAFAAGDFAAVEQKGAEDAGAVFIRQRFRDGLETVYGPAPQSFFDEGEAAFARRFEIRLEKVETGEADKLLRREKSFDPDLWVLEIEAGDISDLIEVAEE